MVVSLRKCVLCAQKGCLMETFVLSTQNMRFDGE